MRKVHLGRPPRSAVTVVARAVAKFALGLARVFDRSSPSTARATWTANAKALAAVATARDRFRTYRSARRDAGNGGLVICDRFPLPQLSLMDALQVQRHTAAVSGGWLGPRLLALEERYYRAISSPDVLLVLRVDPDVAVGRKPDEPPEFVRARWREIWEIDWDGVAAHVVDAGRPPEEVLRRVKSLVWAEL